MCCFSQPVVSVRATNIFARAGIEDRQFLVYSMSLEARKDLAMILPLPVKTPAGEKDLEFIDLKGYPNFFEDLNKGFLAPPAKRLSGDNVPASASMEKLEVVRVGDFEASFVPAIKDFSRLDERFRLPPDAWKELPQYKEYGFAVFKLKLARQRFIQWHFRFRVRTPMHYFFRRCTSMMAKCTKRRTLIMRFIANPTRSSI